MEGKMITSLRNYLEDIFEVDFKGIVFAHSNKHNCYFVFDCDRKIIEYINGVMTHDQFERYDFLTDKQFNILLEKLKKYRVSYGVYSVEDKTISKITVEKFLVLNQYKKMKVNSLSSNKNLSSMGLKNYINDYSNLDNQRFELKTLSSKVEYGKYIFGSIKKKTNSVEDILELNRRANSRKSFRRLLAKSRPSDKATWANESRYNK